MKIALIGPGIMPIPPEGWGGVEHLIWNFYLQLKKVGDEPVIVNTKNLNEIISTLNEQDFDAVHLHYDQYANIMPYLKCRKQMITSHYPYLEDPEPQYVFLYDLLKGTGSHIVSLSDRIKDAFIDRDIPADDISVYPVELILKCIPWMLRMLPILTDQLLLVRLNLGNVRHICRSTI